MARKLSFLVSVLSILVVSLLLSGCGRTPASAVSPINIGLICSCTGPYASSLVGDEATYKAWASATNAAGGINGHKVHVFFSDDLTNPATSRSEVETMITADHVVAITDDSGFDTAWEMAGSLAVARRFIGTAGLLVAQHFHWRECSRLQGWINSSPET